MRLVGANVPRVEDRRILTGRGHYVDDIQLPHMLHAAFLRSPLAHARITGLDATGARQAPGVVAVYTGDDMKEISKPIRPVIEMGLTPEYYPLVTDKVLFVGDLVAMVVAESRQQAEDACELIEVDYDPLPPVRHLRGGARPGRRSPLRRPGEQRLGDQPYRGRRRRGGVRRGGPGHRGRAEPAPHRQRADGDAEALVADYDDGSGQLTVHAATQSPQGLRIQLATTLEHPLDKVLVLTQDVGGAFGLKGNIFREDFCACIATKQIGRPVKWIEDRNEHLLASGHAREEKISAQVAVTDAGDILGIKAELIMDQGAYPGSAVRGVGVPVVHHPVAARALQGQGLQL